MSFVNDFTSIQYAATKCIGSFADTHDLITINVPSLHICEASINGIDCQVFADQQYTVNGITHRLCDEHFRLILRIVYRLHLIRRETRGVA